MGVLALIVPPASRDIIERPMSDFRLSSREQFGLEGRG